MMEVRSRLRVNIGTPFISDTAAVWAVYVKELTDIMALDFPDFWHVPQVIHMSLKIPEL